MRVLFYISFFCLLAGVFSCQNQENPNNTKALNISITVDEFEKKLLGENTQLIDVRTPEEFNQGHLKGALNYNINAAEFESQISKLDKNKPVLVYCLSGGRSGSAADLMTGRGFTEVYNMQGGIMKWSAANKSLDAGTKKTFSNGLSVEDFNKLIKSDRLALIDYNAKWCKPCKKMAPMLEAFVDKRKEKMVLIKIDADENKNLLQKKGIESIPVLELYKDCKLIWKHEGEIDETTLISETKL